MSKQDQLSYVFGPFRLVPTERLLVRDGKPVPLAPKVFDTLLALVEDAGRLVEKDKLITRLWPDTFVEEATLARNISDLRKALGETCGSQAYIETVPKAGYRFVASVRELRSEGSTLLLQRRTTAHVVVEEEQLEDGRRPRSIAVLPFKSLGGDERDEYLGLGMADALITRLSNVRRLMVRPTSAIFRYAGQRVDPVAVGSELGVESVVDGSIQCSEGRLRVTVQLVSVSDKAVIWAGKFDERLTGIFEVEDSISERIAASLELELTVSERALLARRRTDNIDAYQAYLKGRFFLNKRTTRWIKRSVECFKEAARLDPAYAEAHAGLCDSYTLLVTWDALTPIDGLMKANSAAQHALEIDAGLAEAHAGLAHAMLHAWQFDDAEREFKRALDLNPGYAATYLWYAEYLAAAGRFEEAIDSIQRARQQDPLSSPINAEVGWVYYLARRYNEAAVELKRALDLDPDSFLGRFRLWHVYTQQGLREEAAEELGSAIALSGEGPLAGLHLGYASAASGNREQALKLLGELIGLWKQRYFSPYWIALIHTALEDIDSAFEWLERGYENRDARMILLRVDPVLDLIRGDQRFDSLLWRVGLSR